MCEFFVSCHVAMRLRSDRLGTLSTSLVTLKSSRNRRLTRLWQHVGGYVNHFTTATTCIVHQHSECHLDPITGFYNFNYMSFSKDHQSWTWPLSSCPHIDPESNQRLPVRWQKFSDGRVEQTWSSPSGSSRRFFSNH
jgi:hypothetical protein